jgi:LDH2 family malate/lactate/ureidoglycolate dehydrogenase
MATTTVAIGKLLVAARWNKPIPSGWALDDSGEPTIDPFVALKHRLVTPLGGTRDLGSHKGFGLGMMVDILSGVMSGAVYGDLFYRTDMQERRVQNVGHCFAAIDPAPLPPPRRVQARHGRHVRRAPQFAEGRRPHAHLDRRGARGRVRGEAPALVGQCGEIAKGLGVPALV